MHASLLVLAAGVLCGLWDAAFGVRLYQPGRGSIGERLRFAWTERRLTVVGFALVLASVVLEACGV